MGTYVEDSETALVLNPDESQWTALGSRHDRQDTYGTKPLARVLANVNVNLYLVLFPVQPRPMGAISGDPHRLRAGRDYPIWPSSVAQRYVVVDRVQIDVAATSPVGTDHRSREPG